MSSNPLRLVDIVVDPYVTRRDLRDEIDMANEAFALSPMLPRGRADEQDYDAIREAFLDPRAAAGPRRIRQAQPQCRHAHGTRRGRENRRDPFRTARTVVEDRLPEALVAIRDAIREAETIAIAVFDPAAIEASLAPIPRGLRIIEEMSWRWREIGAEGRICDLIDLQLTSIEAACVQIRPSTLAPTSRPFSICSRSGSTRPTAEAGRRRAPLGGSGAGGTVARAVAPLAGGRPAPMASGGAVAFTEPRTRRGDRARGRRGAGRRRRGLLRCRQATDAALEPETVTESQIAPEETAFEQPAVEPAAFTEVTEEFSLDAAAEAEDEAILDAIALEMAAPDPEFDEIIEPVEMEAAIPEPMVAEAAAPIAAEMPEPIAPESPPPRGRGGAGRGSADRDGIACALYQRQGGSRRRSDGAAGAGHGGRRDIQRSEGRDAAEALALVRVLSEHRSAHHPRQRHLAKAPRRRQDPMAPIRRMTQAEKITFFS